MRDQRIKKFAAVFLLLIGAYAIYYLIRIIPPYLNFAFFEPNWMLSHQQTSGYVTMEMRWIWLLMWIIPIGASLYAIGAALYACNLCRIGMYFDPKFGTGLVHMGFAMSLAEGSDIIAESFIRTVLTIAHPDGLLPFAWRFTSSDLALLLHGLGVIGIGLVIREASLIAEENKAFV